MGKEEWMKVCIIASLWPHKLDTLIKTNWYANCFISVFLSFIILNVVNVKFCFMIGKLFCIGLQEKWSCFKKL
jgi:hypothetical protein